MWGGNRVNWWQEEGKGNRVRDAGGTGVLCGQRPSGRGRTELGEGSVAGLGGKEDGGAEG